jgi:predicted Zn-dependent peptidase
MAPAVLVLVLMSACSVARRPAVPAGVPEPTRHVLTNGVRVIVQPHAGDVVALQLWVAAGARDELASELGLAHYLEHMLFKGTAARPAGSIEREVEGVGGRINAGTSLDYTYYHVVLPARRALAGVELLADIATGATLDGSMLEREKAIVLEEMRVSEDSARRHLGWQLYGAVFEGHAYGRPVIGTPALIGALSRDALVGFYRRHYVPEAFTLVAAGAVDPAGVLATAERTLGAVPRSGQRRLPVASVPGSQARSVTTERPGTHAYLALGWGGPRVDHGDAAAVDLLAAILGQRRSSRLFQSVREARGLVTSISAAYSALEIGGLVSITAQLEPENVARAEAAIVDEIRRVRDAGVKEAEVRRAVTGAEARRAFARETAEGRAFALGWAETVWRVEDELAYLARLRGVSAEHVRQVARRYLDPERYARVTFVPPAR